MADKTQVPVHESAKAVGSYLRFLREAANMTVAETANKVGIDVSQIWRIEKGKSDPRASILFRFITAVDGSSEDIARLINNPKATPEDGESLAKLRRGLQS